MEELKVGDLVRRIAYSHELVKGDIYVVKEVDYMDSRNGTIKLFCRYNLWYDVSNFKKIDIHGEL